MFAKVRASLLVPDGITCQFLTHVLQRNSFLEVVGVCLTILPTEVHFTRTQNLLKPDVAWRIRPREIMVFFGRFIQGRPRMPSPGSMLADLHPHYDPLPTEGQYIRLLHLLPGEHGHPISCKLSLANLDALEEPYIAVSYTWGPADIKHTIWLNGMMFSVRENLYELLHAFRQSDGGVRLWIDAICIDQSSLKERNHQVKRMGEIFSKAERVNAWLGFADPEIDEAFTCLEDIARTRRENWSAPQDISEQAKRSMSLFQGRTYWSRAWIIQELVLARDISFFWGTRSLSWSDIVSAVSMFDKERAPTIRAIAAMRGSDAGQRSFEELFARFGHQECALDHDKFYSLYGMVKDTSNLGSDFPLPDYALCITEIFMQQFLRWENQYPVQSPMNFVSTFIRHFPQANYNRGPCRCHSKSFVSFRLPFRGTVRDTTAACSVSDKRMALFCVQREDDIYRFRRFKSANGGFSKSLRHGDLAFDLEFPVWNLVVRPCEDNCRQDDATRRKIEVIGLVYHDEMGSSKCFSPVKYFTGFATDTKLQLNGQENVLTVRMRVGLLTKLACFVQSKTTTSPFSP
jgi:hypothetical protein